MNQTHESLTDILARELAVARELETLLARESAEIAVASAEDIEKLAAAKAELARQAAALGASRAQALVRAGLPAGRRGLELACARAGREWTQRLEALLACAQRVRLANERNGAAVDLRLRHAGAALAVLRRDGPEVAQVYSRDGLAHGSGPGRSRATA